MTPVSDPVILNHWHPLSSVEEMAPGEVHDTVLLEQDLSFALDGDGLPVVWHRNGELRRDSAFDSGKVSAAVRSRREYGYIWACLGDAPTPLFSFPEFFEPDRRFVATGMFGVNVSPAGSSRTFSTWGTSPTSTPESSAKSPIPR